MEISPTSSHKNAVFVTKNMAASSVTLTDVEISLVSLRT